MTDTRGIIKGNLSYPSQLDSFEKKSTADWGMSMAQAIASEWFFNVGIGGVSSKFYTARADFLERRMYAKGKVPMTKYLPSIGTNGDVSLLNLPKKSLSIIPKLVDVVVNGMTNRNYSIHANAIDPISLGGKQAYRKRIQDDQKSLPIIQKAKETFGMDIASMPIDQLPQTEDELNLHLQMEYKPSNCLSEEMLIAMVLEENMHKQTIEKQIVTDLVVCGVGWEKNRFHPGKGIILEYVDPANKIQSQTNDPYFRDCFYHGEFKTTLISDVLIEYPYLNDEKYASQKEQLMNSGEQWNNYNSINQNQRLKGTTNLLYFTYKTTREKVKKVIETETGGKVVGEFTPEANKKKDYRKYKTTSLVEEVLFEGVHVLGTDILLKWEVAQNMSRPKGNKQKVVEQYNGIAPNYQDGFIDSLVYRMIPIEDQCNITELKAVQISQGIKPDGIAIDLDAIANIEFGDGSKSDHNTMLNMWLQSGNFFYRSSTLGGDYTNAKPFQEVQTGDSINKLVALRNECAYYIKRLTDVIGLNEYSDASTPDKDSLVGIQKIASLNSNLATRHILEGMKHVTLKTAECISYRIADVFKYFPKLKEELIQKLGATAVADLESVQDHHLSDFAIYLTLEPDDEEKAKLEADLSLAIEKGLIGIDDKYKIIGIKILDLAVQYLTLLIKKREKKMQEQKAQEAQQKSDMDIRTSEQANQFAQQTIQLQMQADAIKQKAIADGEIAKEKARGEQDRLTLADKSVYEKELQMLINSGAHEKLEKMQSDKEKNLAIASTATSRIADQKAKEKDPIDFASEKSEMEQFEINQ